MNYTHQMKKFISSSGTFTATFEGAQLKDKKQDPRFPNAKPQQYIMLEFKTSQGEWVALNVPTKIESYHKADTLKRITDTRNALGLTETDKWNQAKGKTVTITTTPNQFNGKTYFNITTIIPFVDTHGQAVQAAKDVFDI